MQPPLIVLAGAPTWTAPVHALLDQHGFAVLHQSDSETYQHQLTEQYVALILVDGADPHWRFWVLTPKIEQATRRIPIVVLTADPDVIAAARSSGADATLDPAALGAELVPLVRVRARIPDPERLSALDCDCQEALPPLARQGVEKFNAGAFYAQHDAFEEQWMHDPRPVRDLYQGILQIGVAYYHIEHGNYRGGLKMLRRSVQWLALLPDVCQGVNVARLRADAARVRATLEALPPGKRPDIDRNLFQPIELIEG